MLAKYFKNSFYELNLSGTIFDSQIECCLFIFIIFKI